MTAGWRIFLNRKNSPAPAQTEQTGGRDAALTNAYSQLQAARQKLEGFLGSYAFRGSETTFKAVQTTVENRRDDRGQPTAQVDACVLSLPIEIASTNVVEIDRVAREVTGLIRDKLDVESQPPAYTLRNADRVKMDLLAETTRNARERAGLLVKNGWGQLGALSSAQQGVFQITAPDSTETSHYGAYDTATIPKAVKAVVTLEYYVEE